MPETRSSATDQVMSQTSLNKGQRQMDSVLKSWGFRTSRDPFQQNSSQGLEANKGQKTTPLREVVCPLERFEREPLQLECVPGTDATQQAEGPLEKGIFKHCFWVSRFGNTTQYPHGNHAFSQHLPVRGSVGTDPSWLRQRRLYLPSRSQLGSKRLCDLGRVLVPHLGPLPFVESVRLKAGGRFFDVLTARVFQEKKP